MSGRNTKPTPGSSGKGASKEPPKKQPSEKQPSAKKTPAPRGAAPVPSSPLHPRHSGASTSSVKKAASPMSAKKAEAAGEKRKVAKPVHEELADVPEEMLQIPRESDETQTEEKVQRLPRPKSMPESGELEKNKLTFAGKPVAERVRLSEKAQKVHDAACEFLNLKRLETKDQKYMENVIIEMFPKLQRNLKRVQDLSNKAARFDEPPRSDQAIRAENEKLNYLIVQSASCFREFEHLLAETRKRLVKFMESAEQNTLHIDTALKNVVNLVCDFSKVDKSKKDEASKVGEGSGEAEKDPEAKDEARGDKDGAEKDPEAKDEPRGDKDGAEKDPEAKDKRGGDSGDKDRSGGGQSGDSGDKDRSGGGQSGDSGDKDRSGGGQSGDSGDKDRSGGGQSGDSGDKDRSGADRSGDSGDKDRSGANRSGDSGDKDRSGADQSGDKTGSGADISGSGGDKDRSGSGHSKHKARSGKKRIAVALEESTLAYSDSRLSPRASEPETEGVEDAERSLILQAGDEVADGELFGSIMKSVLRQCIHSVDDSCGRPDVDYQEPFECIKRAIEEAINPLKEVHGVQESQPSLMIDILSRVAKSLDAGAALEGMSEVVRPLEDPEVGNEGGYDVEERRIVASALGPVLKQAMESVQEFRSKPAGATFEEYRDAMMKSLKVSLGSLQDVFRAGGIDRAFHNKYLSKESQISDPKEPVKEVGLKLLPLVDIGSRVEPKQRKFGSFESLQALVRDLSIHKKKELVTSLSLD